MLTLCPRSKHCSSGPFEESHISSTLHSALWGCASGISRLPSILFSVLSAVIICLAAMTFGVMHGH